jgi:hypothetical protein
MSFGSFSTLIKHGSKGVAFGRCRQQYQSIQLGGQDAIRDNVRGFSHLVTRLRR